MIKLEVTGWAVHRILYYVCDFSVNKIILNKNAIKHGLNYILLFLLYTNYEQMYIYLILSILKNRKDLM